MPDRTDLWEGVQAELLECYGEGEDTDWPYLNDLTELIVSMIEKYGCTSLSDDPSDPEKRALVPLSPGER